MGTRSYYADGVCVIEQSKGDFPDSVWKIPSLTTNCPTIAIVRILERFCFEYLRKMLSMVQAPGSSLALDYWQPSLSQSEQIRRLRRFFASHFAQKEQDYTFIDSSFFGSLDGYLVVEQADAKQLHCHYYHEANLDVSATLAEHYVLLKT